MRASSSAAATPLRLQIGSSSILLPPSLSSIASNATASASLSALLPPLPSRFPSDLILHFQQPEHEESTAVNLVRQRPAPDLYLPPLRWHVTGDFSEVTAATGGSAVPPSLTVAGTSQQGRRQPDQDLRTFWCFELVNSDELDAAASQSALQEITELATPFRTSTHRVAAYFVEAMPARLVSSCVGRWLFTSLPHASSCLAAVNTRTDTRFQVFDAAKQAIQEAFEREDGSHIIITRLIQWPGLLHIFASGPSGPPRIRLTGLGASMEAFQATGKRFLDFADTLGMSNEFCLMSYKTRNLDLEKLGIGARWRTAHSLYHVTFNNLNTLYLIQRYKLNDQRDTNNEVKWASEKQDGGEEKISKWNAGLNTASLVFIKYPNTYTPGCIQETYEGKTICDLDDKGEYELPKVWLTKENMQKLKKKKKAVAPSFTAFKVAGIKNHTRYFLLLVLFCNLITGIGSSSRSQSSRQGFCPKPDIMLVLLPAHETVCPLLDISSVHWTHSKREETQQRETTYICEVAVFLISAVCCLGPWFSVSNLEPVQGKVHKFLYFFSLTPVKMWYLTLAMSVNYYVSMVVYGVMSKSDQSCEIWGSNAIYCSIFLLLVAYLCYRQKITFQVDNMVLLVTCLYVGAGAVSIGLMHGAFVLLRPANFEQTFYFEKIALIWLVVMFVFRISTVEYTAFNAILNIMAALTPLSLFCTHGNKWDGILVISSSALRIIECVIWGIWWMLGRNILIVIENVNP